MSSHFLVDHLLTDLASTIIPHESETEEQAKIVNEVSGDFHFSIKLYSLIQFSREIAVHSNFCS